MMQAAVGHENQMPPGNLAVDDAAAIDARLADEESTKLQDDLRPRQARVQVLQYAGVVVCDERDIEPLVARKIRDPKAAADVEDANRSGCILRHAHRELDAFPLRFGDRIGAKV